MHSGATRGATPLLLIMIQMGTRLCEPPLAPPTAIGSRITCSCMPLSSARQASAIIRPTQMIEGSQGGTAWPHRLVVSMSAYARMVHVNCRIFEAEHMPAVMLRRDCLRIRGGQEETGGEDEEEEEDKEEEEKAAESVSSDGMHEDRQDTPEPSGQDDEWEEDGVDSNTDAGSTEGGSYAAGERSKVERGKANISHGKATSGTAAANRKAVAAKKQAGA